MAKFGYPVGHVTKFIPTESGCSLETRDLFLSLHIYVFECVFLHHIVMSLQRHFFHFLS